jgi:cell wall-associated NlpC family hydrolase
MRHKGLLCAAAHDVFYTVKFKPLAIATCWLLASSLLFAAPEDDQVTGSKRAIEKLNLIQLGDQVKTSVSEKTNLMLGQAMTLLGVPYKKGGNSAESGFDCSGFVRHIYETSIGRLLPRRAEEQAVATEKIDRNELNPGDLVFFNTMRRTFSHVGIYIGDGKFIHAPSAGKAVRVDDLRAAYWTKRFTGARRVQEQTTPDSASR